MNIITKKQNTFVTENSKKKKIVHYNYNSCYIEDRTIIYFRNRRNSLNVKRIFIVKL